MKPVVPQPIGGPDPDPIPVTAVPGRLRGLSGQFVIRVGDGDGGVGGVRGAGVICGKGGPDPETEAASPGRLRGLSGKYVDVDGDGRVGGVRGAGAIGGKGGPYPETEAASPGRLRGLSGKHVDVDGDRGDGGVRGVGAFGGKESWTGVQRRRQRRLRHVSGDIVNRDDVLKFVADTNKLSRQKKGGFETGPKLHGPSTSCYLCSSGLAVCLGKGCMGKGKLYEEIGEKSCSPPASKPVTSPSPSVIPGLVLSPNR